MRPIGGAIMPQFDLFKSDKPVAKVLTSRGFANEFHFEISPYRGVDFSRIAYLFCGQGQMSEGAMADQVRGHPVFLQRFKQLDDISQNLGMGKSSNFILDPARVDKKYQAHHRSLCLFTLQS